MRVEPAPYVFRSDDRRQRFDDRRMDSDRRDTQDRPRQRAQHAAHTWFQPAFGAHILGQIAPEQANPAEALLAYTQPESRTPLTPQVVANA
jgi:hypothetical protein